MLSTVRLIFTLLMSSFITKNSSHTFCSLFPYGNNYFRLLCYTNVPMTLLLWLLCFETANPQFWNLWAFISRQIVVHFAVRHFCFVSLQWCFFYYTKRFFDKFADLLTSLFETRPCQNCPPHVWCLVFSSEILSSAVFLKFINHFCLSNKLTF